MQPRADLTSLGVHSIDTMISLPWVWEVAWGVGGEPLGGRAFRRVATSNPPCLTVVPHALQLKARDGRQYNFNLRRWFPAFIRRMKDIGIHLEEKVTQQLSSDRLMVTAESIEAFRNDCVLPELAEARQSCRQDNHAQ